MIKATALISAPILCGALFFLARAPGGRPGVYVESYGVISEISSYATGRGLTFSDVPMKAPVVPDGTVYSFFIVGPRGSALAAQASSAKLYFFVVDETGAQVSSEYLPVPMTVHQINPRAYQVTAEELMKWGPESAAVQHYRSILGRRTGSRASLALMVGLVIQDPSDGSARMYPVRFERPADGLSANMRRR